VIAMLLGLGLVLLMWIVSVPLHRESFLISTGSYRPLMALCQIASLGAILGANVIFWGMLVDCLVSNRRPVLWRFFWFVIILLTNIFGATVYYFRVFGAPHAAKLPPKVAV
jgi:hypothetical protein